MIAWSKKLSKNYAVDIALLYIVRSLKDGITFFELKADISWFKGDHNPKFEIMWVCFNFVILNLNVYNVHHTEG